MNNTLETAKTPKTYAEKKEIAKSLNAQDLLRLFLQCHDNYDPFSQECDDTYTILKAEIHSRCSR